VLGQIDVRQLSVVGFAAKLEPTHDAISLTLGRVVDRDHGGVAKPIGAHDLGRHPRKVLDHRVGERPQVAGVGVGVRLVDLLGHLGALLLQALERALVPSDQAADLAFLVPEHIQTGRLLLEQIELAGDCRQCRREGVALHAVSPLVG